MSTLYVVSYRLVFVIAAGVYIIWELTLATDSMMLSSRTGILSRTDQWGLFNFSHGESSKVSMLDVE